MSEDERRDRPEDESADAAPREAEAPAGTPHPAEGGSAEGDARSADPEDDARSTGPAETPQAPPSPPGDSEPPSGDAGSATGGHEAAADGDEAPADTTAPPPAPPARHAAWHEEPAEVPREVPGSRLRAQSRRDFLIFAAGVAASAAGAWWLLPSRTKRNLLPGAHDRLDTLAARLGLTNDRAEGVLDRALDFDDDVAEALYSKDRRVRTYSRSDARPLRNNYNGMTPGPEYLNGWKLEVAGLASGRIERLDVDALLSALQFRDQVTRLVCVEGWSGVAWWGGVRFADFLDAFPPAPGARWASLRSAVNLDGRGRPDPYYVSIDLATARHPQTLLATHHAGRPLTLAHGAPLRLLAPMKLGLKNIKAITSITYSASEPRDYWNERGYSKYDGL